MRIHLRIKVKRLELSVLLELLFVIRSSIFDSFFFFFRSILENGRFKILDEVGQSKDQESPQQQL